MWLQYDSSLYTDGRKPMRADVSVYGLLAEAREFRKLLYGEKPIQRF
jgi:hypothetical protein